MRTSPQKAPKKCLHEDFLQEVCFLKACFEKTCPKADRTQAPAQAMTTGRKHPPKKTTTGRERGPRQAPRSPVRPQKIPGSRREPKEPQKAPRNPPPRSVSPGGMPPRDMPPKNYPRDNRTRAPVQATITGRKHPPKGRQLGASTRQKLRLL